MPLKERLSRVVLWLNQSFLLELANRTDAEKIIIGFNCMHTNTALDITVTNENGGQFQIRTDDMQLAGQLGQPANSESILNEFA